MTACYKPLLEQVKTRYFVDSVGCWIWTGPKNRDGYGRSTAQGIPYLAHRAAYELLVAPIPEGLKVCHSCDKPACINPEHLFIGTQADNINDSVRKGRWRPSKEGNLK